MFKVSTSNLTECIDMVGKNRTKQAFVTAWTKPRQRKQRGDEMPLSSFVIQPTEMNLVPQFVVTKNEN